MDIRGYVDVDVDLAVGGLDMPIIQSNPIHSEPYGRRNSIGSCLKCQVYSPPH